MIAIISDIHANHAALMAVLDDVDKRGIEKIVCLGDIAGYYCEINECCDTLRQRNVFSLMGNHDQYLVSEEKCLRSNSVNRCIDYQKGVVRKDNFDWLASLKPSARFGELNIVHGGWGDELEEYLVPSAEYFERLPGTYFASGHTHVPVIWSAGEKIYCNPGSVGQPRDGDPRASYAVWTGQKFELHRVVYDCKPLQKKMQREGFDAYFYENLDNGTRLGGKIDRLILGSE
ncbi:MAG: metallophosphatase family protein [Acidiferrobacterales bacterium]|nr:metallophosphatase family protein [Acidiferrobacterales bacterium]